MSKEQKFQLRNKNILEVSEKINFHLFCPKCKKRNYNQCKISKLVLKL